MPNSFVSIRAPTLLDGEAHTIALVDKVEDNFLFCSHAITSINEQPYIDTKKICADYGGEYLEGVSLIDSKEFDIVFDTKIIPIDKFKNL